MTLVIDRNLLRSGEKHIIAAWHLPTGDGVIILLDYSQSQANCIVTARVCASAICARTSRTLSTVFCFSNFPPRHSWECQRKLTVCSGILGGGTYRGKPLVHTFVLLKVTASALLLEGETRLRDWPMLPDPGGLCVLGWPCVIETWCTVTSQKRGLSRPERCPVSEGWVRGHTRSCTALERQHFSQILIRFITLCCSTRRLRHVSEGKTVFLTLIHL